MSAFQWVPLTLTTCALNSIVLICVVIFLHYYRKFLSIVPILDWFMIFITVVSCISMTFENPTYRITDQTENNQRYLWMVSLYWITQILANQLKTTDGTYRHGYTLTEPHYYKMLCKKASLTFAFVYPELLVKNRIVGMLLT